MVNYSFGLLFGERRGEWVGQFDVTADSTFQKSLNWLRVHSHWERAFAIPELPIAK